MLILLPFVAFGALFVMLLGRETGRREGLPWQGSFLLASALCGAALVVMTEGLSLFTAIGRPGIVAGWILVLLGALVWGRRREYLASGWRRLRTLVLDLDKFEIALLIIFGVMALVLLAVVFAAPVNTVDVLQYHMPRVLQWSQNGSLEHFPAANVSQNSRPYWAEGGMLHLRLLWGGDKPVELVNWVGWLALAVPASGTAILLGGVRSAAWLAALIAWTIPTAILHATTGMVDLPGAFWAGALGYFVVASLLDQQRRSTVVGIPLATGLGMLTKGSFIPFAAGLLVLWGVTRLWRRRWRGLVLQTALLVVVVAVLNGPFWARNLATYGGPYGRSVPVQTVGELVSFDPTPSDSNPTGEVANTDKSGLSGQASQIVRMGALHFLSPLGRLNQALFGVMQQLPGVFPPAFVNSLRLSAWNNTMNGGSPLHFAASAFALAIALLSWRQGQQQRLRAAGLSSAIVLGYLLLSLLSTADSVFGVRYQLAFLLLGAPLVATLPGELPGWAVGAAGLVLILYAAPYALLNQTRPVVGLPPWPTKSESVFLIDDAEILFAQSPEIHDEYALIAATIRGSSCKRILLEIGAKDLEYTIWWLLEAPRYNIRVNHIPYTSARPGPTFRLPSACLAICTNCETLSAAPEWFRELDAGHVHLFVNYEN